MKLTRLFSILVIVGVVVMLVLVGCSRVQGGTSNPAARPSSTQVSGGNGGEQLGPVIEPTLDAELEQLDSQLNGLQQTLDAQNTLDEYK